MGLLKRLGNLIRGFFALFVGGLEKDNPELLFEDIKNQIEKARKESEQQIIEIQTNAELIKIEMKNAEKNLAAIKARIETASKQNDKEVLVALLMQEEEYTTVYETHKATYESVTAEAAKIREDYKIFESEMQAKLNELNALKSQSKMAGLRENINSLNAQFTAKGNRVGGVNDAMDKAREIVNERTARANAIESLGNDDIDMKLKRLDLDSARERAMARAEALLGSQAPEEASQESTAQNEGNQG